jgi:hypothetical protein
MAATMGRPLSFYLGTISLETDVTVYIFKIEPVPAELLSDLASGDWRNRAAC